MDAENWVRLLNGLGVLGASAWATIEIKKQPSIEKKKVLTSLSVNTIGILMWPLIWSLVIGFKSLSNVGALVTFVWPMIILLNEARHAPNSHISKIQAAAAVTTLGFAMASLANFLPKDQQTPSISTCKIVMWAIVLLSAFVIHTPTLHNQVEELALQSAQNVAFIYATGLIVAAAVSHLYNKQII